jgi:uncharacterized protein YprB with RNaseH-like and TPR domain
MKLRFIVKGFCDYSEYKNDKQNDLFLVRDLWELFDEADVIVAHNLARFDARKANSRFLYHNLPPPSPYEEVDTLKICRKYFALHSNKLSDVTEFLGVGTKFRHEGIDVWFKVMDGDAKAWKIMKEYNRQDIKILQALYNKVRSWAKSHPNLSRYFEYPCCGVCTSFDVEYRGYDYSKKKPHQRIHCRNCGHWATQ